MHDPLVLIFDVRVLRLDIWHDEPGGRDSGQVCGHYPMRLGRRALWALRHVRHLRPRWWPYLNVRRWIVDRCDHCGQRFRWRDARDSYQSTDRVWHDVCMALCHARGQLDDLTGFVLGTAGENARWRANYRLEGLERAAREVAEGGVSVDG
jgi:hypothetical protein